MITCVFSDGTSREFPRAYLEAASPVFKAMMAAEMAEAGTQRVEFTKENKDDVQDMLRFLDPCHGRHAEIDGNNVERLLPLFHLYQLDPLYEESCGVLAKGVPTPARVALAQKYGVKRAIDAFVKSEAAKLQEVADIGTDGYDAAFKAAVLDEYRSIRRREAEAADDAERVAKRKMANFQAYVADYVNSTPEHYAFSQMKRRLHDALDKAA